MLSGCQKLIQTSLCPTLLTPRPTVHQIKLLIAITIRWNGIQLDVIIFGNKNYYKVYYMHMHHPGYAGSSLGARTIKEWH